MDIPWHLALMGGLYMLAGLAHWKAPRVYLRIMPPWIPFPKAMVWVSGLVEVALGAALLIPAIRDAALLGIVGMLVAFLPVHIHMLRNAQAFPKIPLWILWARIPLQALLIYWACLYL